MGAGGTGTTIFAKAYFAHSREAGELVSKDYKVIAAGPNEQNLKQHVGSWVIVTINGTGGGPS